MKKHLEAASRTPNGVMVNSCIFAPHINQLALNAAGGDSVERRPAKPLVPNQILQNNVLRWSEGERQN